MGDGGGRACGVCSVLSACDFLLSGADIFMVCCVFCLVPGAVGLDVLRLEHPIGHCNFRPKHCGCKFLHSDWQFRFHGAFHTSSFLHFLDWHRLSPCLTRARGPARSEI